MALPSSLRRAQPVKALRVGRAVLCAPRIRQDAFWPRRGLWSLPACWLAVLAISLALALSSSGSAPKRVSNVIIGGGGYITGLIIHPSNPNLIYARTDVGGAYRWDAASAAWIPLLDWVSVGNVNLYGVESFAIDPSDTNVIYLACGKNLGSSPRGVYKSTDRGATWRGLYLSNVNMSANDGISGGRASPFVRNAGERLAVDPNNGSIIYFGSRTDGLWKSVNAGVTWSQVTIPNEGVAGYGVTFVAFDPTSGHAGGGSTNIYLGIFGSSAGGSDGGVYRSSNAGASWAKLANPSSRSVNQPRRGQCSPVGGTLWVTHQAGVAKAGPAASALTDVTPSQSTGVCYNGLALDPANPSKAVVIRGEVTASAPMYRTSNAGASWSTIAAGSHNSSVPWWSSGMWAAWVSACAINPLQPNQLWYGDWYGVWKTEDYTAGSPVWHNYEAGHEEVVTFTLSCPPAPSADLLSGCADMEGFRHNDVNAFPPYSFGNAPGNGSGCNFQAAFGLDYCENHPNFVVRASGSQSGGTMGMCKSANNGASWTLCAGWSSAAEPRRVAVSASNTNVFLTILSGGKPMVTSNGGSSFTTCGGITENGPSGPWETAQPLAADRVDGTKFYYYIKGKLYRSTDSGQNFTTVNTALADNTPNLKAMPAINGCLVLSLMGSGLWLSTNSGSTFNEIKSPLNARINARAMGLGRPAAGSNAWIYIYGTIDGAEGCHVSQDLGATWTRIDTGATLIGCGPNIVEASRQILGRIYIGTSGRGVFQLDGLVLPRLSIVRAPGGVTASWPASAAFDLYSTPSLPSPVWTRVSGSPVLSNGCRNLALPASGASRFYRLGGS